MLFLNLGKLAIPCSSSEHKKIVRVLFVFFLNDRIGRRGACFR